jgi:hypothetical protein
LPAGAAQPRQGVSGADDQRLRLSAATRATVASGVSPRLGGQFSGSGTGSGSEKEGLGVNPSPSLIDWNSL